MVSETIQTAIAQELAQYFGVDASRVQLGSGLEEPRILCSGLTLGGRDCNRRATSFAENAGYCHSHIPCEHRDQDLPGKPVAILPEGFREEWEVCRRIISRYVRASLMRDVPPPEELAFHLLRGLQEGLCLMCGHVFQYPDERDILRDHDHKTGMVRALLCVRCNSKEKKRAFSLKWAVYRLFAPANGWHYRYTGPYNAQWKSWDPDPVVNRVTGAPARLTVGFCEKYPELALAHFLEFAEQVRGSYTPIVRPG